MTVLHEVSRRYTYDNFQITIQGVRQLEVSKSGNHRLITEDKHLHIVKPGWIHIEIVSTKGWEM